MNYCNVRQTIVDRSHSSPTSPITPPSSLLTSTSSENSRDSYRSIWKDFCKQKYGEEKRNKNGKLKNYGEVIIDHLEEVEVSDDVFNQDNGRLDDRNVIKSSDDGTTTSHNKNLSSNDTTTKNIDTDHIKKYKYICDNCGTEKQFQITSDISVRVDNSRNIDHRVRKKVSFRDMKPKHKTETKMFFNNSDKNEGSFLIGYNRDMNDNEFKNSKSHVSYINLIKSRSNPEINTTSSSREYINSTDTSNLTIKRIYQEHDLESIGPHASNDVLVMFNKKNTSTESILRNLAIEATSVNKNCNNNNGNSITTNNNNNNNYRNSNSKYNNKINKKFSLSDGNLSKTASKKNLFNTKNLNPLQFIGRIFNYETVFEEVI
ncbi:hypothetical protein HELRODRAFT_177836 [Helobdella robusta]|uniref:Uncharacterized protein n=1 Tax=Helobdella robusta TaxID=6412 RepID=T1FCC5_HELRO|nr:hypothetical protein HELRODRAFT_177836 [Helobdella robusta]ESN97773.1 hypothetical protein HELRODRAFT_177836 [Helobdella robusta]